MNVGGQARAGVIGTSAGIFITVKNETQGVPVLRDRVSRRPSFDCDCATVTRYREAAWEARECPVGWCTNFQQICAKR